MDASGKVFSVGVLKGQYGAIDIGCVGERNHWGSNAGRGLGPWTERTGSYRWGGGSSIGSLFRGGANYPRLGFTGEQYRTPTQIVDLSGPFQEYFGGYRVR
jgi:hypothetical protein